MTTAFDSLAADYDRHFTDTAIGRHLRARVQKRLLKHFYNADLPVLELGCGTGEDALFLAQHGIDIIATDTSPRMLNITRKKTKTLDNAEVRQLDLANLPDDWDETYAGVYSNFGALNCLDDWHPLAQWLAKRVQAGGVVGLGIMSPLCLWEFAWHGLHGDSTVALRRLFGSTFQMEDAPPVSVTYPSVARMTHDFAPYFRRQSVTPLGLFLPPSDVYGVIEKRPRLLRTLTFLDDSIGQIPKLANFADHYWIEFVRV